jgi:hypothetical protein
MRYLFGFICVLALGLPGCGETSGTGGDNPDPDFADHQLLLECGDDSVCPSASVLDIEAGEMHSMQRVECLLVALRDRTPGLYTIQFSLAHSQGEDTFRHVFAITPSAAIETGVVHSWPRELSDNDYLPTEVCNPKSPAFFEDCLTAVQQCATDGCATGAGGHGGAWKCVYPVLFEGPPWFEGCVSQSPTCGSDQAFEVQP